MASVVIADDENIVRAGIRSIIERSAAAFTEIHECSDGLEALELLKVRPVDLVITDIKMPIMDGLELIKRCSRLRPACQAKFIILSGHQDFQFAKTAIHYGVKDYLLKPVGRLELLESIQRIEQEVQPAEKHAGQLQCTVVELEEGRKYPTEEAGQILRVNYGSFEFDFQVFVLSLPGEPGPTGEARWLTLKSIAADFFDGHRAVILCSRSHGFTVLCETSAGFHDFYSQLRKYGILDVVAGVSQDGRGPGDIEAKLAQARHAWKISSLNLLSKVSEYSEQMTHSDTNKILMAMQYINDKYSQDISLASVSNYVSLNYNYFSALFRKQTGMRFIDYVAGVRMLKARQLLADGKYRINEVAHIVGYENPKQFAKIFRQMEGITPFDYRKR